MLNDKQSIKGPTHAVPFLRAGMRLYTYKKVFGQHQSHSWKHKEGGRACFTTSLPFI